MTAAVEASEESTDVVEIDAIDVQEWDRDRHTPRTADANLAALVKQTVLGSPEPAPRATTQQRQTTTSSRMRALRPVPVAAAKPLAPAAPVLPIPTIARPAKPAVANTPVGTPIGRLVAQPRTATTTTKPRALAQTTPAPSKVMTTLAESAKRDEIDDEWDAPARAPIAPVPAELAVAVEPVAKPVAVAEPVAVAKPIAPTASEAAALEPSVVVDLGGFSEPESPPIAPAMFTLPSPPSPTEAPPSFPPVHTNPAIHAVPRDSLPIVVQQPTAEVPALVTPPRRSRGKWIAIAAAAAACVAGALVIATASLGGDGSDAHAAASLSASAAPSPAPASHLSPTPSPAPPPAAAVVADTAADDDATAATPPPATIAPARRFAAKKPVVNDFDRPPTATTAPDGGEALTRARAAYALGNQQLFAGHATEAIAAYQSAIADYPNYAAGYRGLGLAYTQANDHAQALKSFIRYVALVPTAKDVPLIRRRIVSLSRH